jgi:hypothetical protein
LQGYSKALIRRILQKETCLNARYSNDAIYSVESLPSYGVTFGGKKNQRLRMKGKISRDEYTKRRNCLLISRGDRAKEGNLNLRVINDNHRLKLRISIGTKKWIYPKLTIPAKYYRKYGNLLDGTKPYLVQIKRRNDSRGYDVLITVEAHCQIKTWKRVMALDINSGHIDYAVLDEDLRLIQVGRFSCFALLYASSNKRMFFLYKLVKRITKIAKHFDALVIVGRLNTGRFRSWNKSSNRMIKTNASIQIPKNSQTQINA